MQLTEAQLIEEVLAARRDAATPDGAPGMTMAEICEATSLPISTVRRTVRGLIHAGRWRCSGRALRSDGPSAASDGRRLSVPVYAPVERRVS